MNSDEVFYKSDISASTWRFGVIFSYIAVRSQCILVWKIQEKKMTDLMIALLIPKKIQQKTIYVLAEGKATFKAKLVELNCGYHILFH